MGGASGAAGAELSLGTTLGPYRLEDLLGEGGMGVVYRATDADGATVAIKVLKRELTDDVYRRRLAHEARAARDVQHRHLVPVLDVGEADGRPFIVSAYIAGRSLDRRVAEDGPLPPADVARVAAHVGAALDVVHAAGLVHRDVKPSNVLLGEDGAAYLCDFGLAKGPDYTRLTTPRRVMGTLDYLAPELIRGEPATAASDVYALGCLVYECLAGKPPFADKSVLAVGVAHLSEEPADLAGLHPGVSRSVSWTVLQALQKEPAKRPPSATAYAVMLKVAVTSS